jgi:hypothetical protein
MSLQRPKLVLQSLLVPALDRAVALSLPGTVYPTLTKLSITLHIAHGTGTTWLQ